MEFDEEKAVDVSDEDDDPIVAEMPVFLSQKAADYLCLIQYPLRKAHRPLHADKVELFINLKHNKQNSEISIEISGNF